MCLILLLNWSLVKKKVKSKGLFQREFFKIKVRIRGNCHAHVKVDTGTSIVNVTPESQIYNDLWRVFL